MNHCMYTVQGYIVCPEQYKKNIEHFSEAVSTTTPTIYHPQPGSIVNYTYTFSNMVFTFEEWTQRDWQKYAYSNLPGVIGINDPVNEVAHYWKYDENGKYTNALNENSFSGYQFKDKNNVTRRGSMFVINSSSLFNIKKLRIQGKMDNYNANNVPYRVSIHGCKYLGTSVNILPIFNASKIFQRKEMGPPQQFDFIKNKHFTTGEKIWTIETSVADRKKYNCYIIVFESSQPNPSESAINISRIQWTM